MNSFVHLMAILGGSMAVIALLWRYPQWKRRRRRQRRVAELRKGFAAPVARDRSFSIYRSFLDAREASPGSVRTDDQTWKDLNLHVVFDRIDRTLSTPGEVELYRYIRRLETSAEILAERDNIITDLQMQDDLRESIQLPLLDLGRTNHALGVKELIWSGELPDTRFRRLFDAQLFICFLGSIAASFAVQRFSLSVGYAVVAVSLLFALNMAAHYWSRWKYGRLIYQIRYLSKLISAGGKLSSVGAPCIGSRLRELGECHDRTRRIPAATRLLFPERTGSFDLLDAAQEYFAIMFLTEVRSLQRVADEIRDCRSQLQRLFIGIGELDTFQSVASFRAELGEFARPTFCSQNQLQIEDACHPLIDHSVPNSVSISPKRQCLITGSNMSGKSTLLRAIGVNAILAQSIVTCAARSYSAPLMKVITSMTPSDDLIGGKSFYLAEAERLLEMLRASEGSMPALCIIDEVLRGTNTRERIAAATAILRQMAIGKAVVVAATHDRQLTQRLANEFDNFHFTETVNERGIQFDYQLRPGHAVSTNALRILQLLGYPAEIVEEATRLAGPL